METLIQISGGESRFLLTTRMNVSYSSDACITVPGLEHDEYSNLIAVYGERFGIDIPRNKYVKLHKVTDGSPLFTESLIRLIKLGLSIDDAIRQWKGESGDDARQAALKREIEQLSPESRRMLYALSLMSEASATELRQVTSYTIDKFEQCVNELSSLFLLKSPPIIKSEQRYAVSDNTARIISQNAAPLLTDPKAIERRIKDLRNSTEQRKERDKSRAIGMAINQSIALLRDNRGDEALATIKSALKSSPNHRDLLFAKARCLMKLPIPSLEEARKTFRLAFDYGQTKSDFFNHWHSAELDAKNPHGIIEVCDIAIKNNASDRIGWELNKAMGYWILAQNYKAGGNSPDALKTLMDADDILSMVINNSVGSMKVQAREWSTQFHDDIWELASSYANRDTTIQAYDVAVRSISQGDMRNIWFDRAIKSLDWLVQNTYEANERWLNFLDQSTNKILALIQARESNQNGKETSQQAFESINNLKYRISSIRDKL